MSLTQNQQDFLAAADSDWADFRAALEAALHADNDPLTTLADLRTHQAAVSLTHRRVSGVLGHQPSNTHQPGSMVHFAVNTSGELVETATGAVFLLRSDGKSVDPQPYVPNTNSRPIPS